MAHIGIKIESASNIKGIVAGYQKRVPLKWEIVYVISSIFVKSS